MNVSRSLLFVLAVICVCGWFAACDRDDDDPSTMPGDEPAAVLTEEQEELCFDAGDGVECVAIVGGDFESVFQAVAPPAALEDEGGLGDEIIAGLLEHFEIGLQVEQLSSDPLTLGLTFDQVETARGDTIDGHVEIVVADEGAMLQFTFDELVVGSKTFSGVLTFTKLVDQAAFLLETDDFEIVWQTRQKTLSIALEDISMLLDNEDTIVTNGTIVLTTGDTSLELTCIDLTVIRTEQFPTGQVELVVGGIDLVITFTGTSTIKIGDGEGIELRLHLPSHLRGATLGRHMGSVRSVTYSPDGEFIASGGGEGHVKIWSVGSRRLYHPILAFQLPVYCVAYSPDGTVLAAAGEEGIVKVFDMSTYEEVADLQLGAPLHTLTWSPDGQAIATGLPDSSSSDSARWTPTATTPTASIWRPTGTAWPRAAPTAR